MAKSLRFVCIVTTLAASLCGCAAQPTAQIHGAANFRPFIPTNAKGFELSPNQKIVLGEPIAQAVPTYPQQLIAQAISAQSVCLTIAINERGVVFMNQPLYALPGCPTSSAKVAPAFLAASRDAVAHWRFHPAVLCTFPNGVDASRMGNACTAEGAKVRPIAISLAFVFTFTVARGVPHVHTDSLTPAR